MSAEATARPSTVSERLRTLADWHDVRDDKSGYTGPREVQRDLRADANTHDAALSALREARGFVCALGDNAHVLGVTVPQMLARIDALLAPDGREKP